MKNRMVWLSLFFPLLLISVWLVHPFLQGAVWGILLAIAMYPLFSGVAHEKRFRLAAIVSFSVIILIFAFMGFAFHELLDVAKFLIPLWKNEISHKWPIPKFLEEIPFFHQQINSSWDRFTKMVSEPLSQWPDKVPIALSFLRGTGAVVSSILIAIFVFFFSLKDSPQADDFLASLTFLHPWVPSTIRVGIATLRAILWSVFLGVIGEIFAFWGLFAITGVPHPFVIALFCAVVSIIPIAGTIAVCSIGGWLIFTKGWIGLAVIIIGLIILGTADNYAKPVLAKLVDPSKSTPGIFWILVGMLSGVTTIGVIGVFIGPAVFAMLIHVIDLLRQNHTQENEY